nr:MAG TPA: hypothetical protein [Bacteriophage sp.]
MYGEDVVFHSYPNFVMFCADTPNIFENSLIE